jgi:benzoate/toluate 1,2-dioxygenase beta subunit
MSGVSREEIEAFLIHEARLLDERRFEEWLALFGVDGFYWIPSAPEQNDPDTHISVMYEDRSVLGIRIARLRHPRAYAAAEFPRTAHLIGNITVDEAGGDGFDCQARSTLFVAEFRRGERRLRAGLCLHRLRRDPEGWKIVLKRIDLVDSEGVEAPLLVPI